MLSFKIEEHLSVIAVKFMAIKQPILIPFIIGFGMILAVTGKAQGVNPPGVYEGKLSGCPDSPNCVSTQSEDESHVIAPFPLATDPGSALECLKRIIQGMKRTKIVLIEKQYFHAEFRTLLGFTDDVEFYIDETNRKVQMRSASRFGYWDFGVNRRRLEEIRSRFDRECRGR